jgi:hypothetical protein
MGRRSTSLNNYTGTAITREIDSKYDVIKEVSGYLGSIEAIAEEDIAGLIAALNEAKDFSGITVVSGETAGWDPVGKVLTVVKGIDGVDGADGLDGTNGVDGKSAYEVAIDNGFAGNESEWLTTLKGATGATGAAGSDGADGLMPIVEFTYDEATGNLQYEVIGYTDEPDTAPSYEEW